MKWEAFFNYTFLQNPSQKQEALLKNQHVVTEISSHISTYPIVKF